MLVSLVADYGTGDLAFAEAAQRLVMHLPDAIVSPLSVPPFDSLGAGFCVAQLARNDGPADRIVYCNVAPRADDDEPREGNEGERLLAAPLPSGVLVVGVDSPYVFSFLKDEADEIVEVPLPESGSQFRSRDVFPQLVAALARGDAGAKGASVPRESIPEPPDSAVLYVDGYGNVKTSLTSAPAPDGAQVDVEIGGATVQAVVSDGTFGVAAGKTSLAPGSSGWRRRDGQEVCFYELLTRGASAAELFGHPAAGTRVEVRQTSPG